MPLTLDLPKKRCPDSTVNLNLRAFGWHFSCVSIRQTTNRNVSTKVEPFPSSYRCCHHAKDSLHFEMKADHAHTSYPPDGRFRKAPWNTWMGHVFNGWMLLNHLPSTSQFPSTLQYNHIDADQVLNMKPTVSETILKNIRKLGAGQIPSTRTSL